jgi:hypothetical protein
MITYWIQAPELENHLSVDKWQFKSELVPWPNLEPGSCADGNGMTQHATEALAKVTNK